MKNVLNYSINHMMILILFVVSVVPIVAFGVYSFEDERNVIESQNIEFMQEIVYEKSIQVNYFFDERLSDVEVTSKLHFMQEHIPPFFSDDLEKKN